MFSVKTAFQLKLKDFKSFHLAHFMRTCCNIYFIAHFVVSVFQPTYCVLKLIFRAIFARSEAFPIPLFLVFSRRKQKKKKNSIIFPVSLYRASTDERRRRADQRRNGDGHRVDRPERRRHGHDSQGVRELRQTHHRTILAQGTGPVLARGLPQVRLLRLSLGRGRVHVVHQGQPHTLQKGLSQVRSAVKAGKTS